MSKIQFFLKQLVIFAVWGAFAFGLWICLSIKGMQIGYGGNGLSENIAVIAGVVLMLAPILIFIIGYILLLIKAWKDGKKCVKDWRKGYFFLVLMISIVGTILAGVIIYCLI